jgi:hypothetical protein
MASSNRDLIASLLSFPSPARTIPDMQEGTPSMAQSLLGPPYTLVVLCPLAPPCRSVSLSSSIYFHAHSRTVILSLSPQIFYGSSVCWRTVGVLAVRWIIYI